MKLTDELKKKIDNYFDKISTDDFIEILQRGGFKLIDTQLISEEYTQLPVTSKNECKMETVTFKYTDDYYPAQAA